MDEEEKEILFGKLQRFRVIRSVEIARDNLDRLELLTRCARKEMMIRSLTLENLRLSSASQAQFNRLM
jgi:hypothetical protein